MHGPSWARFSDHKCGLTGHISDLHEAHHNRPLPTANWPCAHPHGCPQCPPIISLGAEILASVVFRFWCAQPTWTHPHARLCIQRLTRLTHPPQARLDAWARRHRPTDWYSVCVHPEGQADRGLFARTLSLPTLMRQQKNTQFLTMSCILPSCRARSSPHWLGKS